VGRFIGDFALVNCGGEHMLDGVIYSVVGGTWYLIDHEGNTAASFNYPIVRQINEYLLSFVEEVTLAKTDGEEWLSSIERTGVVS